MSVKPKPKPKPQTTEINNIRNTLADVIDGLGQIRGEMHQRFDQQDKRFDQQGSDIAAIKEMLQVLLSRQ
ncbi:hypothetical protein [Endozoicomonas sp. ALC020]|uniref:hypothetical protein n=1 Tax=unclassified Endozoicomonas TaxID=2644528 RepID=UPI003BAF608C